MLWGFVKGLSWESGDEMMFVIWLRLGARFEVGSFLNGDCANRYGLNLWRR